MTDIRHITEAEYAEIAKAVLEAKYPSWTEANDGRGWCKRIFVELPFASVTVRHYEDGHWEVGTTDEDGRREMLWEIDKSHYVVEPGSFAYYTIDEAGDYWDTESDFDSEKLEALLNQ